MKDLSILFNRSLCFVAALLVVAGCRQRSYPEFYEWESRVTVLVAQDGDDAYDLPEMKQLITKIDGVPESAYEGPKAKALSNNIKAEMARIAKERQEQEQERLRREAAAAAAPRFAPTPTAPSGPAQPAAPAEPQKPDPKVPYGGMSIEDFQKEHSGCMSSVSTDTKDEARFKNIDTSDCRAKYSLADGASVTFIFRQGQLAERNIETRTRVIIDAGRPAPPATPKPPPEPQMRMYIPGAPRPDAPPSPNP